jgi:hypothetical protein
MQESLVEAIDFHIDYNAKTPGKGEVIHPMYAEYKRILTEELEYYRYIKNLDEATRFINQFMGIVVENLNYKSKIKGFHLAFNIVEPKTTEGNSNYKFRMDPKLTAE